MFSVININHEKKWIDWLAGFPEIDIYYLPNYHRLCMENGNSYPFAAYYEDENGRVFYPFLEREIAGITWLKNKKPWRAYKDIITVYGYSGPLVNSPNGRSKELLSAFRKAFNVYCQDRKIVSEFIRFHPLLQNHADQPSDIQTEFNRYTVVVDLQGGPEKIWMNLSKSCRNKVRKARKNQVKAFFPKSDSDLKDFIHLYHLTMQKVQAEKYYYFSPHYFSNLKNLFPKEFLLAKACLDNQTIASGILFCHGPFINFHLSSSNPEMLHLAPNNLLDVEVANYGAKNGFKYLHLGGGYRGNDSLFKYKKSLAPNGQREFWTGQKIHLENEYKYLENLWMERANPSKTDPPKIFPVYRS